MNKKIKQFSFLIIISILIFFAYKIGYQRALAGSTAGKFFTADNFSMFFRAWDIINKNFVDPQKIDNNKAIFEATRGLLRSLNDPYSDLLSEDQKKVFEEDLAGSFGGVGFEVGIRKGVLTVIAPLEGTPAERAGLKAGDKILKINDEETTDMSLEEAVAKIRGKPGTQVTLTIFRDEWVEAKDFKITRETIDVPVVKSKLIRPNLGYIKINIFGTKTYPDFIKAYYDLKNQGAQRFILDLRNNPGGYLEVAIKMSGLFLERGKIILKEVQRNKGMTPIISEGPGIIKEKTVVLINKGSASASEIFAGALRDNLGIKLIGEKSYGKGSVQQTFSLNGNMLKLTIAYWFTPKGSKIEGNGLEPDIEVKEQPSETEKDLNKDPILDKAIEILKGQN